MAADPSQHDPAEQTTASAKAPGIGAATAIEASLGHAAGTRIGPYVLLSVLGEGGFGVVWVLGHRRLVTMLIGVAVLGAVFAFLRVLRPFDSNLELPLFRLL